MAKSFAEHLEERLLSVIRDEIFAPEVIAYLTSA